MTHIESMLASREPYEVYQWARELFDGREYIEAAQALEYLLAEHGDTMGTGEARELLARSYYHSAQLMRAVDSAREILERDPGNAYAVILLVRSLQRAGRTKEAAAAERMALALGVEAPATSARPREGQPPPG